MNTIERRIPSFFVALSLILIAGCGESEAERRSKQDASFWRTLAFLFIGVGVVYGIRKVILPRRVASPSPQQPRQDRNAASLIAVYPTVSDAPTASPVMPLTPRIFPAPNKAERTETTAVPVTVSSTRSVEKRNNYVVDGTNVIRNFVSTPDSASLAVLLTLLTALKARGFEFVCVCDAKTRHDLRDFDSQKEAEKIYTDLISRKGSALAEAPGGQRADDYILEYAQRESCAVLSNDRFRDYASKFPWLITDADARLVKGRALFGTLTIIPLEISCPVRTDLQQMASELLT